MSQGMAIAQDPLPHTSLKAYIVDLKASIQQKAGVRSNAFIAPPADQLDGFRLTMQQLLLGDVASAINGLDALNYDLNSLNDDSGKSYLVAQERSTGFRGLGTYVVDLNYARRCRIRFLIKRRKRKARTFSRAWRRAPCSSLEHTDAQTRILSRAAPG
jgi:hypothetical protein